MTKPFKIKQSGGMLLAGTGRGGLHDSKKNPPPSRLRKQWKSKGQHRLDD